MWISILGYVASASVLATFCMNTMTPLRVVALSSNVLFALFGGLAHIYPVMVLHLVLFPVNVVRLWQVRRLARRMRDAHRCGFPIVPLFPFMSRRCLPAGAILTRYGERADRLFYLTRGQVLIKEIDKVVGPSSVLGEIGVFAENQTRTATVTCLSDCEVFELTGEKAKEIYFQNPAFGYAVLQTVIARLSENAGLSRAEGIDPQDERPGMREEMAVSPLRGPSSPYLRHG